MARSPENKAIKDAAQKKFKSEGRKGKFLWQFGTVAEDKAYLAGASYEKAYGNNPKYRPAPPKPTPPATTLDALKMQFSTFPHIKNSTATPVSLSKQEFIKLFSKHDVRPGKDGGLFSPNMFTGSRSNDNFISADGICLDFDHGQPAVEDVLKVFHGTLLAYYSTHSHRPESPRFRVVILLERSVDADEHARLVKGIKSIIPPETLECIDTTCFEKARPHYLPSCPKETECHAFTGFQDGEPLNVKYFLRLADKLEAAKAVEQIPLPASADTPRPAPEQVATRTYEYTDPGSGEVIDLAKWAAQNPHFDLVNAIDQQYRRGTPKDGKQHIICPFVDQHTDQNNDLATFAANASPPEFAAFDVHCCHAHCAGRDRLEFIMVMLEKGWMTVDQLQPPAPAMLELKRPPYFNYRAQEIAAELVKHPLQPEEFRYHLQLSHVACTAYDGTLPDDSWTISRILGIDEDSWLNRVRPTLIRSTWQVVENGRIFNPLMLREYRISQTELARKISGGKAGGMRTQQKHRERQAHLQG